MEKFFKVAFVALIALVAATGCNDDNTTAMVKGGVGTEAFGYSVYVPNSARTATNTAESSEELRLIRALLEQPDQERLIEALERHTQALERNTEALEKLAEANNQSQQ